MANKKIKLLKNLAKMKSRCNSAVKNTLIVPINAEKSNFFKGGLISEGICSLVPHSIVLLNHYPQRFHFNLANFMLKN